MKIPDPVLLIFLILAVIAGLYCMRRSRKTGSNKPMYIYGVVMIIVSGLGLLINLL